VAVEHVPPSAAVSGRTLLRAVVLVVTFAAPAAVHLPAQLLPVTNVLAHTVLGVVNPGVAYWLFYLLIDEAGASAASVITYVMPVVALLPGVGLLGEKLTIGAIAGLATGRRRRAGSMIERSRTKTTSAGRRHSPAVTSRSSGTDNHHGQYD
jgi:uncharacterized membrane protein